MPTKEEEERDAINPGDNGGFIETPNGRNWGRLRRASPGSDDGAEPIGRASRAIEDGIADIATGRSRGEHPALDTIIGRKPERYAPDSGSPAWAETVCTPECPNRRRNEEYDQGAYAAPDSLRLVGNDIRPSTRERLAVLEHEVHDINRDMDGIRHLSTLAATKDDAHYLDKRIDNVHVRIDRDVLEELRNLRRRRVFRDVIVVTSLIVSFIGNIIGYYIMFAKNP